MQRKKNNDNSPHCPTCDCPTQLVTGKEVYPHRKDLYSKKFYRCITHTDTFVGCHPNTTKPLGVPAPPELRKLRSQVHRLFDPIWKNDSETSRAKAYKWFSKQMALPPSITHVGMFDKAQCLKAIVLLEQYHEDEKEKLHQKLQKQKWKPKDNLTFED